MSFHSEQPISTEKGLAFQPVANFSPALSSCRKPHYQAPVPMSTLASPMAPGEHIGRVREEGGEDWDPTCFGKGLLCAGSHPGP